MAYPLTFPKIQFEDSNGAPLSGGYLYTYAAGTSTPKDTYTDSTLATTNDNPIVLDSNGEAAVWLIEGELYKFVLKDSDAATRWTVDNYSVGTKAPVTFDSGDTTPSVQKGIVFKTSTDSPATTITDFDDGVAGKEITVISKADVIFDTTGTNLTGSSVNLTTATGDVTRWVCEDGTTWRLVAFVDASADNSGGA